MAARALLGETEGLGAGLGLGVGAGLVVVRYVLEAHRLWPW